MTNRSTEHVNFAHAWPTSEIKGRFSTDKIAVNKECRSNQSSGSQGRKGICLPHQDQKMRKLLSENLALFQSTRRSVKQWRLVDRTQNTFRKVEKTYHKCEGNAPSYLHLCLFYVRSHNQILRAKYQQAKME